jgi:flavin reductase (DIM6/NTAB) family NADH-FMN oxidoreductase RutF
MLIVHDHILLVGDVVSVQRSNGDALLYHARKYGSVRT